MVFDISLKGKNALVCGASKGIGKATALVLAELGANVTLLARSEDKLKSFLSEMPSGKHHYLAIDLNNREILQTALDKLVSEKNIHILINNTGGPKGGLIKDALAEEFEKAFSAHLITNVLLTQKLLPGMQKDNYGRIINIISTSVKTPLPNLGVSNTVRVAVANWSKTLASEVAPYGITVNNVLPGYTDTERLTELMQLNADKNNKELAQVREEWINSVPMKRLGLPEEIANAVGFLASPAASYITGTNVVVDGGRTVSL